jgi:hypothetical protein
VPFRFPSRVNTLCVHEACDDLGNSASPAGTSKRDCPMIDSFGVDSFDLQEMPFEPIYVGWLKIGIASGTNHRDVQCRRGGVKARGLTAAEFTSGPPASLATGTGAARRRSFFLSHLPCSVRLDESYAVTRITQE